MCLSSGALWESGSIFRLGHCGLVFPASAFNAQHIHVSKDNFGFMACEIPRLMTTRSGNNDDVFQSDAMWGRPSGMGRCISIAGRGGERQRGLASKKKNMLRKHKMISTSQKEHETHTHTHTHSNLAQLFGLHKLGPHRMMGRGEGWAERDGFELWRYMGRD